MAKTIKKYRSKKTIKIDGDGPIAFTKDKIYRRIKAAVYPCAGSNICLIDERKDEHFMDAEWLTKHFELVKEG